MSQHLQSDDPVPAVREADARGETAEIFDDLRRTVGVPVVNLVWRHFATIPGALPFAWQAVKPAYVSGSVALEADALRAGLPLPATIRLPRFLLDSVGVGEEQRAGILGVLDAYHRSNAMNFVALSALLEHLDGRTPQSVGSAEAEPVSASEASLGPERLPHLLTLAEMTPATRDLVLACNELGERDEGRILASMYRHLAHWPAFLALSWTVVAPLDADGRLRGAIEQGIAEGRRRGRRLVPELAPPAPPLTGAARDELRAAASTFVMHPIGKMVTICALLRCAASGAG